MRSTHDDVEFRTRGILLGPRDSGEFKPCTSLEWVRGAHPGVFKIVSIARDLGSKMWGGRPGSGSDLWP